MSAVERRPVPAQTADRPTHRPGSAPWQARLLLLASIWGMSFVFIKVGDEAFSPLWVVLGRMLFGTAMLIAILAVRRERLPRGALLWGQLAIAAVLFNVAPFTLFAYGETRTTSVLAGIWNATTPLLTLLIAMLVLPDDPPTRRRLAGLAVGFSGVLVVLGVWQGLGGRALLGNLACLGAAACYGLAFPFTRRYLAGRPESTVALATAQLLCGTLELALITPLTSGIPGHLPLRATASIFALGAFGTGIAYVLNYGLIRDAGITIASMVTYLVPLFSTAAGVLILGEPLTWNEPVGALVVIAGIAITQNRLRWPGRTSQRDRSGRRSVSSR